MQSLLPAYALAYALAGALGLALLRSIYNAITSPLRSVPGPFFARFNRLWYFCSVSKGRFQHVNIDVHRKYASPGQSHAPIVRLGPNMYSLSTAPKNVYGVSSTMPKSQWYQGWKHPSPDRWTLFSDSDMKRHSETRRTFQSLYSLSSFVSYEGYVDQCGDLFLQRLRERAATDEQVDMAHWFACYAFDVIGDITYSKRLGFLDEGKDMGGVLAALGIGMIYDTLVGIYHQVHPYSYALLARIPGSPPAKRNYLFNYAQERINQRKHQREVWRKEGKGVEAQEDGPKDFLDRMLDLREDETKNVNDYHVFMVGISNILAGSGTTSITLSSILYYLIKTPRAMDKLRGELREMQEQGKMEAGKLEFKTTQDMRYLQSCIKEALRLHPPAGLPLWRVVPEGGAEIYGKFFPAGSEVGINAWVPHHDPDVWGADVEDFRPERWIEAEDAGRDRLGALEASYVAFGLGSRTCIGRHLANLEISKIIPLLVWNLDFELRHPDDVLKSGNYWFVRTRDLNVRITPRGKV